MPSPAERLEQLRRQRGVRARMAEVGDLRPGSLVGRYRRCGKGGVTARGKGRPAIGRVGR
jgi:hypothetical protein